MNWKQILAGMSVPGLVAFLYGFALVPLPLIEGNPTGFKYLVDIVSLEERRHMWAQLDRIDTKEDTTTIVQHYEYILDQHLEELERIEDACINGDGVSCQIRLKKWEAEKDKLESQLERWRDDHSKLAKEIQMFAKHP